MKQQWQMAVAAAALVTACAAQAEVTVQNAWVRATVAQQKVTGAFMTLHSDKDAQLVAVTSSLASSAELHEMRVENDVMKMRQVSAIDLPAGQDVALKPGGWHVMLFGLQKAVPENEEVSLMLTIQGKDGKRETVTVRAKAKTMVRLAEH